MFTVFIFATGVAFVSCFVPEDGIDIFSLNTEVSNKKIIKEVLMKVISKMEDREKAFEELLIIKPVVGDPSI